MRTMKDNSSILSKRDWFVYQALCCRSVKCRDLLTCKSHNTQYWPTHSYHIRIIVITTRHSQRLHYPITHKVKISKPLQLLKSEKSIQKTFITTTTKTRESFYLAKSRAQLKAVLAQRHSCQYVKPKAGT